MPRQLAGRCKFTKTLSTLCKNKLIQLAVRFNLPTDSSVIFLRDCLKAHLSLHRGAIDQNPRYKGLYLRPWQDNANRCSSSSPPPPGASAFQPLDPSHPASQLITNPSFELWNALEPHLQDLQPSLSPAQSLLNQDLPMFNPATPPFFPHVDHDDPLLYPQPVKAHDYHLPCWVIGLFSCSKQHRTPSSPLFSFMHHRVAYSGSKKCPNVCMIWKNQLGVICWHNIREKSITS